VRRTVVSITVAATGIVATTAVAAAAGGGHGIAQQPLRSGRRSVQALLQTAERVRVGIRTLSHQT
jgi:hypothetical protein